MEERTGLYRVVGIKSSAVVDATSCDDAIRKAIASGAVGEWEEPEARLARENKNETKQANKE